MRADFPVILDANVLAPFSVCDLYLRLAEEPRLYSPRWTGEILEEVRRTQIGKLGWPERLADYWREQVSATFPEAFVADYEPLVEECRNHEEDRHVLAAAIKAPAYAIVTFNLKHFPTEALAPYSIVAHHPADYLCTLYDMDPGIVTSRVYDIAIKRGLEPQEVLRRLSNPLPRFAAFFAEKQGWRL
jgi:hypothetical protein